MAPKITPQIKLDGGNFITKTKIVIALLRKNKVLKVKSRTEKRF